MTSVIGQLLPLAIGVAISPVPIIAAILMLLSPRARTTSLGFLIGWLAGIVAVTTVFTLLSSLLPEGEGSDPRPILGVIQLLLGAALLLLAAKQWRKRPRPGEAPELPKWMLSIDQMSFGSALGFGVLLSAANPKNLLLGVSAGTAVGAATLNPGSAIAVITAYTIVAGCTVLVPVVGYLFASERLAAPLESLRGWLSRESAVIMTVVLLLLGATVAGNGLANL